MGDARTRSGARRPVERRATTWRRALIARWRASPAESGAPSASGADTAPRRELPAELLRRLEVTVLRRLDGFLFGDLSGPFYGPSLDLAEVREYQPGDEVRRIDWHVTARMGTLHVRQYREEREVVAWLVVDRTASMAFGTRRVTKGELALEFAGVVAAVIARTGKVGASSFGEDGVRETPLGGGRRQSLAILDHLMTPPVVGAFGPGRDGAGAGTHLAAALERLHRTLRRRALVFVVSDFMDPIAAAEEEASPSWARPLRLLQQRHDVVAVRVIDPAERTLPSVGDLRLRDFESNEETWVDTSDPRVRREHALLVGTREAKLTRAFRSSGVDAIELSTEREVLTPLLHFARRRRERRA